MKISPQIYRILRIPCLRWPVRAILRRTTHGHTQPTIHLKKNRYCQSFKKSIDRTKIRCINISDSAQIKLFPRDHTFLPCNVCMAACATVWHSPSLVLGAAQICFQWIIHQEIPKLLLSMFKGKNANGDLEILVRKLPLIVLRVET